MDNTVEVKFIKDIRVSLDGIHAESVVVGQVISLPPALATALIRDGFAHTLAYKPIEDLNKIDELLKDTTSETIKPQPIVVVTPIRQPQHQYNNKFNKHRR